MIQNLICHIIDPFVFQELRKRFLQAALSADINPDNLLMPEHLPEKLFQRSDRHISLIPVCSGIISVQYVFVDRYIGRKFQIDFLYFRFRRMFFALFHTDTDYFSRSRAGTGLILSGSGPIRIICFRREFSLSSSPAQLPQLVSS